jgi:predicted dehydrogenase
LSTTKFRIGIAGLGFGGGVHLPVFCAKPNVEVRSLFGRDAKKVRALADKFDVKHAHTSLHDFLNDELDAVVISLPPEPSGVAVQAALDLGLAILGEKPIANSAAHAEALARCAAGRTALVDFEFRELESFKTVKSMIADGSFGRIQSGRIVWRSWSYAQRRQIWSWKTDAARGGGIVTLSGLHLFNLLEWLFGSVVPISAKLDDAATRAFAPDGAQPSANTADLVLVCGESIHIEVHLSNAAPDNHGHRWEIHTDRGLVILDDGGNGTFARFTAVWDDLCGHRRIIAEDAVSDGDYRMVPVGALADRFLAAARNRADICPSFDEGARAQRIMESIWRLGGQSNASASADAAPA